MHKEKGEDSSEIDVQKLCKETLARIKHHRYKNNTTDIEFYETFKNFFTTYMRFDYEFSVQDLEEKIEKIYFDDNLKEHLRRLTSKAEVIEYKDEPYSRDELNDLFDDFEIVVEKIMDAHHKKNSWFKNLFSWFKKEKTHVMPKAHKERHDKHDKKLRKEDTKKEEVQTKKDVTNVEDKQDDMPKPAKQKKKTKQAKPSFQQKINKAQKIQDTNKLQALYDDLLEEYNNMTEDKQSKYYDKIEEIYEKLTS